MKRRTFLKTVGATAGTLALGARPAFADPAAPDRKLIAHPSGMPRRVLGRTGREVSIIGYPGLALSKVAQPAATTALRSAFDQGVNYFDVAPAYGDAEIKMGIAIADGKIPRDQFYLACKTKVRDAAGARVELERSLERLKTDHFDLYQLHVMSTKTEVEKACGPGGVIETLVKAREEGKVRALGFSAHTKQAALELMKRFKFETVMFPVNFIDHYTNQFDPEVLALAKEHGVAVQAIKPISAGAWAKGEKRTRNNWWYKVLEEQSEIDQAIRFSLSLDPVVTVLPTSFIDLVDKSIIAGKKFRPASVADLNGMRAMAEKYTPLFPRNPAWVFSPGPHTEYYAHVA
jgi:predicted aldo/keto reductase-like oxidoreductase